MKIYQIISILLLPLIILYIFFRVFRKKEDKARFKERFAFSDNKINNEEVIWINAVSVGEMNSALILVDEILQQNKKCKILFTTTTLTSADILAQKIKNYDNRVVHHFLPVDSYIIVNKFLNKWRPKSAIFIESEIWPNFLYLCHKKNIPAYFINARMSIKSGKRWKIAKKIGLDIFFYFEKITAQSQEDRSNLMQITKKEVLFFGNLKSQAKILEYNEKQLQKLKDLTKDRKIFLAASTHKSEEEKIINVHNALKNEYSNLLTIIIARHPKRADEIIEIIGDLSFCQRSKKEEISAKNEIYLVDSLGELGIFYKLCDFAFIGGSLVNVGGHNPFEAINLECVVLSGKNVSNFKQIYQELSKNEGCILIEDEKQLMQEVKSLFKDKNRLKKLSENAKSIIKENSNIAKKITTLIGEDNI